MLSTWYQTRHISSRLIRTAGGASALTIGFLAVMRLLYEWAFPLLDWTGRIEIVVPLAILLFAAIAYSIPRYRMWWLPLPLLINLIWLFDPTVELLRSRIVFAASIWLIFSFQFSIFNFQFLRRWLFVTLLILPIGAIYLLTMSHNVGFADTFEFQVTAPKLGIVHPTGYPVYLILGKLWTLIPFNSIAWRLNFGTAIYAVAAAVMTFILLCETGRQKDEIASLKPWVEPAALTGAILLTTLPIVWSQAIAAEVYTLHLLIASAALWLMNRLITQRIEWDRGAVWLALLLGLGMTNHVTTVFLLPAGALVMWWSWPKNTLLRPAETYWGRGLQLAGIFLIPLSLYAYLPIRWRAVNFEPMGAKRFFEWIVGGRFQGALNLRAVVDDPQRFDIVGQLVLDQWPLWLLALAGTGFITLFIFQWRMWIVLLLTTAGFTFYTLSYYVPDLAVFMLPIHLAIAIWCGFGLMSLAEGLSLLSQAERLPNASFRLELLSGVPLLVLIPWALATAEHYPTLDQSADDGREKWARAVLNQDLDPVSTILADSEKHPPLYYVQQIENLRPDLDIMILPDEAAYRAELDRRVGAGETVYLARFLPQLAGVYNLQAAGPLTKVTQKETAGTSNKPAIHSFDGIDLIEVKISEQSPFNPDLVGVELVWRVNEVPEEQLKVFLRWEGEAPIFPAGRLPANDFLPFNGVQTGQIIKDFYLIPASQNPEPIVVEKDFSGLEIALSRPFASQAEMDWQTIGEARQNSKFLLVDPVREARLLIVDRLNNQFKFGPYDSTIMRYSLPKNIRSGELPELLPNSSFALVTEPEVEESLTAGHYDLYIYDAVDAWFELRLRCGWLRWPTERCYLGTITVSGVVLPEGAVNYADKIALLDYEVSGTITPSGQLELETTWQGLEQMDEDYTIFVQVLSEDDQIVGQIDVKPAQGTRPTNLWAPSETLTDKYIIPLSPDLSTEQSYRLIIGFYRLSDFQRLTVVDSNGNPIADHFAILLE